MRGIDTQVRKNRRRIFKEVANLAYHSDVRAYRFTLTAPDTLLLVDHGFSALHGNRAFRAYFPARMRHASHTFVSHFVSFLWAVYGKLSLWRDRR